MKKIIISGGYYATNIGNAFYELGAQYVLNKALGSDARVIMSSNKLDIYWSNVLGNRGVFDYTSGYSADYVVILGPLMSAYYLNMWEDTFRRLSESGTKIIFMSAGANDYDEKEYNEVARILEKHNLYALLTRDTETYSTYKDFFKHSYDGICCALYCNEYAPKYNLDIPEYVILNFDNCREPAIVCDNKGSLRIGEDNYVIKENSRLKKHFPDRLAGGELIIRTVHSVVGDGFKRILKGGNYYLSDVPYDYLNLYANATAVITNRVHAAVASVSYGTPVYLTNKTPRGSILKRVGCEDVYKTLFVSDQEIVRKEKEKYESKIKEIFR